MLAAWAVVPFSDGWVLANIDAGLLFLLAITSLEVYGVIIAGWASNSKYPLLGGLRSAAQLISYEVVITSYSIHYTKLYDDGRLRGGLRSAHARGLLPSGWRLSRPVITSYSIHYTKLYEPRPASTSARRYCAGVWPRGTTSSGYS